MSSMPKGIPRDQSTQRRILHRLKISRGHLDRVIKMVKNHAYCIDVIHQSLAVQSALRKTDKLVLAHHLETCVAEAVREGRKNEVIAELMKVMEKK